MLWANAAPAPAVCVKTCLFLSVYAGVNASMDVYVVNVCMHVHEQLNLYVTLTVRACQPLHGSVRIPCCALADFTLMVRNP